MKFALVIPTYNEKENIGNLLPILLDEFSGIKGHELHVVVVDGNSPDGTSDVVRAVATENPNIHLIVEEEKTGIGGAYINGMSYAIAELHADGVFEMDADFQHDPKDIKRFIQKFEEGYDYIIGSRYIKGGSIPEKWQFHRKFLSYFGNLFARLVLGTFEIHDITSGYRLSRASLLSQVDLTKLEKKTYVYKIQLLYLLKKKKAKLTEIPIQFGLRDRGDSKMERENIVSSLKLVLMLRVNDNPSFFKFLIVGLVGLFVQTAILFGLTLVAKMDPKVAIIPAFLLAVFSNFVLNNIWSFKDRKLSGSKERISKFVVFLLVNVGSFFIQRGFIVASQLLSNGSVYITLFIGYPLGIGVGIVWNYLFYSRIVWRKKG